MITAVACIGSLRLFVVKNMCHTITALKIQKGDPDRVNVFLDGEYAFSLRKIIAAWLKVGQEISDEQIDRLNSQDVLENAYLISLRALDYRARTEDEIRAKLTEKGFSSGTICATIERLKENHFINDERFARDWVENQSAFRPRGRRLLKMEMRHKGIDEQVIDQALVDAADEESLAYQAAQRPAQRMANLNWQDFRKKMTQYLARRGFSYNTTAPVVSRLWAETHSPDPLSENGNVLNMKKDAR